MFDSVSTLRLSVVTCTASAALVGWTMPRTAWAETPDPATPPQRGYLTLDSLDAYLEFQGEYTRTRVSAPTRFPFRKSNNQRNKERQFEERIGLKLGGTLIDPSFITFGADFGFALTQDESKEDLGGFDRSDTDHGYLLRYDARIDIFRGRRFSGSAHALRQDDRINRRFQSTLDQRRTGFGTSWVYAHDKVPMELTYDYLETDRTGNLDRRDDEHFAESTLHYALDWLITDHHKLSLSYEHAETKQEYQGMHQPFETVRDLLTVEDELEFGAEHQHSLRTLLHWQEESGDFARDLFEIGHQLTLKHSENLRTMYKYQFNRERYEGLDIETQRVDLQLAHTLYTNLATTLDVFVLYEDIEDDVNTIQYGVSADWQYNRKNRFGHLYANLAIAYDTEEVNGDDGLRVVLDEAHTFRDPRVAILWNRNVVQSSIVVTDTTNRRIFQPGADYVIFKQNHVITIARVRNGRIADGDTVLVDYQFRTPADGRLDTLRVDFSLEQRFTNGLTPYYRWSYRNQEDDVSFGFARRADRTDHHRIGARYDARRFSLG
ncbi:MAG: hypothetical protein ACE5HE_14075, partial [Phycisphaerae bacterium]